MTFASDILQFLCLKKTFFVCPKKNIFFDILFFAQRSLKTRTVSYIDTGIEVVNSHEILRIFSLA